MLASHSFKIKKLILFLYLQLLSAVILASTPVEYGGHDDLDACMSSGHVANLSSGPDGFLAVKESPNIKAARIDKLFNNQRVWICSESKNKQWLGVVYTKNTNQDCGVSQSIKTKKPYKGPCQSGWVSSKWINIDAG